MIGVRRAWGTYNRTKYREEGDDVTFLCENRNNNVAYLLKAEL
jgi:hypothetical protein